MVVDPRRTPLAKQADLHLAPRPGTDLPLALAVACNSPTWAKPAYENWQWPLFITVAFATFCVVGALLYWVLEDRAEKRYDLGEAGETDKVEWGDLFSFGRSYVWVVLLCVTFYSAIFPFQTFAIKFFQELHSLVRSFGEEKAFFTSDCSMSGFSRSMRKTQAPPLSSTTSIRGSRCTMRFNAS